MAIALLEFSHRVPSTFSQSHKQTHTHHTFVVRREVSVDVRVTTIDSLDTKPRWTDQNVQFAVKFDF